MVKHKPGPEAISKEKNALLHELILYNDHVNTFDFVIESLMEVCDHDYEQADQCALVAHYKGKCQVRQGGYDEMKPMYDELTFRGLTVSLE